MHLSGGPDEEKRGIVFAPTINKGEFYKGLFGEKSIFRKSMNYDFIYLMLNNLIDYFKIGKSKTLALREKTLQADESDIELISYRKAPSNVERQLHKHFKSKQLRGDWFNLNF